MLGSDCRTLSRTIENVWLCCLRRPVRQSCLVMFWKVALPADVKFMRTLGLLLLAKL